MVGLSQIQEHCICAVQSQGGCFQLCVVICLQVTMAQKLILTVVTGDTALPCDLRIPFSCACVTETHPVCQDSQTFRGLDLGLVSELLCQAKPLLNSAHKHTYPPSVGTRGGGK